MEDKAVFFAQYWLQEYCTNNSSGQINWMLFKNWVGYKEIAYIPLKSLSSISDEDAMVIYEIESMGKAVNNKPRGIAPYVRAWIIEYSKTRDVCDYLRSKGYALPFRDHTIEKMIKLGWIKIKD